MKTAGIDIGTTTISGVVLEKGENGQAKILEAKTVENGCFVETGNDWERMGKMLSNVGKMQKKL